MGEEKKDKEIAGLVFVACMFIGAGIGLLFGRPDGGWLPLNGSSQG